MVSASRNREATSPVEVPVAFDVVSSVLIPRSPAEVFAFVTDPGRDLTWTSGLLEVHPLTEGPLRRGSRLERVSKFLSRRLTYTIEIQEVVPDERIEMVTTAAPFPIQVTYLLQPEEGGTRFSIRNRGEPQGFFALTGPLLAAAVRRQVQLDVETLRDVMVGG
jgi:uncharacterized protein YndB with AHSA1/START domain